MPPQAVEAFGAVASGIDKSAAVVKGAVANAAAAGLQHMCDFQPGNARSLDAHFQPNSFDLVVTNAPWGLQTATGGGDLLDKIYHGLLTSAHRVTRPGARMVVLVLRWQMVLDWARRTGLWAVLDLHPVRTSALTPIAVVLERLTVDPLKALLAKRVAEINTYFGVGFSQEGPDVREGSSDETGAAGSAQFVDALTLT